MHATITVAVRAMGRKDGEHPGYQAIYSVPTEAPADWRNKQLGAAVSVGVVKKALASLGGSECEFDNIEFTIDFEESV